MFTGIELVADKQSKATLDPALKTHAKMKAVAQSLGLLMYPGGGTIDGVQGDHILLAPPFICTAEDISRIVELLTQTIHQVLPVHAS